jgi:tRNA1(Val) A37 N6-methylase TrmN6
LSKNLSEIEYEEDYPLCGSKFDVPLEDILLLNEEQREHFLTDLLDAFSSEIGRNAMSLKRNTRFHKEMRDARKVLRLPADSYLFTDEKNYLRNVLGKGSPGSTHTYWSRKYMWRMATQQGDLTELIKNHDLQLMRRILQILDESNESKAIFRKYEQSVILTILGYLDMDFGVGTAFPPFHAKFLADKFLPQSGRCLIVDPCAGWGGRLFGSLCVNRSSAVKYIGIDPEKRNKDAYEGLVRRLNIYMKNELRGRRTAQFFYRPFEDWIVSKGAQQLFGKADLVMTSPPYFSAEKYNTQNENQSASRYQTYDEWREGFYRVLVEGANKLLKQGGIFVLNIADVASAEMLESDARKLATEAGFKNAGFFKLAMSCVPGTRGKSRHEVLVNGKIFKYEPVFCFEKA